MRKSEELARRWMPGTRNGPGNRAAWEHPQDLVNLLAEMRGSFTVSLSNGLLAYLGDEPFNKIIDIAWGHDLIEDGRKDDGSPVTADDLRKEGLGEDVVQGIVLLTHNEVLEEKIAHLAQLKDSLGEREAMVKVVDRTCNLREGRTVYKDKRWARVIQQTNDFIVPLFDKIPEPFRTWLRSRLFEARDARPVVDGPNL
jgi:hypothetical protein